MTIDKIQIPTPDGLCTTEVVVPDGGGPWPAAVMFFDAAGHRPAQTRIAQRIAAEGYVVLQPDVFHRLPPLAAFFGQEVTSAVFHAGFKNPEVRAEFMRTYHASAVDYQNLQKTIGALLKHIAARPDVRGRVGTTGYCMGGNVSVRVGSIFGDQIAATAGFHPGRLVTEEADSPHLRAQSMKSRVYLGPAVGDLPPEVEAKLRAQFDAGRVHYEIEQYNAKHGYVPDDGEAYDHDAAERYHTALTKLFRETLHL